METRGLKWSGGARLGGLGEVLVHFAAGWAGIE